MSWYSNIYIFLLTICQCAMMKTRAVRWEFEVTIRPLFSFFFTIIDVHNLELKSISVSV